MKTFLIAAALLSATYASVQAGSLIFSATPGGLTKTQTLTDAEVTRIVAWAKSAYGQICEPPPCRDRTNAEAFDAVATGIFRGIRDNVLNYERELARKPAGDAVAPIGVQ